MPILDKGCFCCKLQTCVRTQGYITAVLSVLSLILGVVATVKINSVDVDEAPPQVNKEELRTALDALRIILIVLAVSNVIHLVLAVLLLVGSYLRRKAYILPYLILSSINIVFGLCIMFAMLSTAPTSAVVSQVLGLALNVYCWVHVLSYYQELQDEEGQSKPRFLASPMMQKV